MGRPAKKTPSEWTKIVEDVYGKQRINAVYPEKAILEEWKVRIPHDTIHEIMLEKGFAREQKQRRKPWIRYEREHSLSVVHMDWYVSKAVPGKGVCRHR